MTELPYKRKLIEVALPLEAINKASAREKSIRHGHPSTLHLWWARRPLAACRAVLFASLVDDPSSNPDEFPTPEEQEAERTRLFDIIERLVKWESTTNEAILEEARTEIRRSTGGNPPAVLDPFCGGGSIPLEAQRLGLTAYASDLNPVAVLITKALIEIPPRFADRPPAHPDARRGVGSSGQWRGAAGLAADVRAYGAWMREEAERRIGHLYPKVRLPREQGGGEATAIAWLWARTVTCPNPACRARMPLVRSFALSTKRGKEAWVQPVVDRDARTVRFEIRTGNGGPPEPPKVGRGASFRCLVCEQVAPDTHVKAEGRAGRMDAQLMAVVAEGQRRRIYLAPTDEQEAVARSAEPAWGPEEELADDPRNIWTVNYGLTRFRDLFTPRQLVALTTFSELVGEARERVLADAIAAGLADDRVRLNDGGIAAPAYADAVATYLAFGIDKLADRNSSLVSWAAGREHVRNTFGRQALPMTWDFSEVSIFSEASGNFLDGLIGVADAVRDVPANSNGAVRQSSAKSPLSEDLKAYMVSTDPPYYDNIGYADLSDYFFVWLRRSLSGVFPSLFETLLTPKADELIASPYRHGNDKRKAEAHFEQGLSEAFAGMRTIADASAPTTIYYAFKQAEGDESSDGREAVASTGWETMLEALLLSGFAIVGTWPTRTEVGRRFNAQEANALASSIVLVCRPRSETARVTDRKGFTAALKAELPEALRTLQHGSIAPVDLQQAAIGPGMAVFSRYAKVLEPDGSAMSVRTALGLINQALDEVLAEQEGEFDRDTRFAVTWFSQRGFEEGPFGEADVLARARDTSAEGLVRAGIAESARGKVRLLGRDELDPDWDPSADQRPTVWEATQHLIRRLLADGESSAADLIGRLGGVAETARDLAYRLYVVSERKGWTEEARAYNALVVAWPELTRLAEAQRNAPAAQPTLGLGG